MKKKLLAILVIIGLLLSQFSVVGVFAEEAAPQTEPAIEAAPVQSAPAEVKTAERPAEVKVAEKPAEVKAVEKPAEAKEAEKPAETKAAEKPAETKAAEESAEAKAAEESAEAKAAESKEAVKTAEENTAGTSAETDAAEKTEVPEKKLGTAMTTVKKEAAATAASNTVNMNVRSLGHGKVKVNGTDYGTEFQGTWPEGTEVSVEAVPDSGYEFSRWWIKSTPSNRRVTAASTTLVAGTDTEAEASFGRETASVTITAPAAGTTAATAPQVSMPSGVGYTLDTNTELHGPNVRWVKAGSLYPYTETLDSSTVFEAGKTYYAYVRLAQGTDSFAATAGGSSFNTELQVTGGTKSAQSNFAATTSSGGGYAGIEAIIAVTIPEATTHTVTFDTQGGTPVPTAQTVNDGSYATKPANPSKSGFYLLGWYEKPGAELTREEVHSGGFKFADTAITEDKTLYAVWYEGFYGATYDLSAATPKYANTGGDVTFTSTYQQKTNPSKVWWDYSIVEGSEVTVTAIPAEGSRFVGWAPGTLDSSDNMPDDPAALGAIVSTANPYTFTFNGRTALAALFEPEAPKYELSFAFTNLYPGAQPQTLVESLTVNGEDWTPTSGNITAKDIPAGSSVTATVKVTDNASLATYNNPGNTIADLVPAYSDDGSELTFTFTMPEKDARIVVYLFEAVTVAYDANGGTKTDAWTDFVKWMKYTASTPATINVSQELYDVYSGEPRVEPPAGAKFAGIEVTQNKTGAKVTGKPGTVLNNINFSEGGTIKFLWEKDVTVTFDAKGGTPAPAAQTFTAGGKATKPADPTKTGWEQAPGSLGGGFDGWYTDENYTNKFDFDTEVTDDITLYARWNGQIEVWTHDKTSGQNLIGGTFSCENVEESVTGMYSYGSSWIAEGTPVTLTATPATGYRFVGWAKDSATGEIISKKAKYEFTFTDNPTTLFAVFEEIPPVLTLHASSVEGDDFVDPIEIEAPKKAGSFMTIAEALEQYKSGTSLATELFQVDGYEDYGYRTPKPMSEYSSYVELWNNNVRGGDVIEADMDIYYSMDIELDSVELTIKAPVCGTETTTSSSEESWGTAWDWEKQTNKPEFLASGEHYAAATDDGYSYWNEDETGDDPYVGKFVGGESYYAEVWIKADFGYIFASENPALYDAEYSGTTTVKGGTFVKTLYDVDYLGVVATVTAVHDPGDLVEENRVDPTCTKDGSYDEVIYCKGGKEELSRETKTIPAIGHNWGEGEVTKEPTAEAEGEITYTCKNDESHTKTESIPKVTYACIKGDGQTWTKGSGEDAAFAFERSYKPETTYQHYEDGTGEILVDGEVIDPENYTTAEGSLLVTLRADYLETLEAGAHTLTATFDEATADAKFTVAEEEEEAIDEPTSDSDTTKKSKTSGTSKKTSGTSKASTKKSSATAAKTTTAPKTGDDTDLLIWFTALGGAMLAALYACGRRRMK